MAALIPLLVAAYLAAHFWIGWRLVVAHLPAVWNAARRIWIMEYREDERRAYVRNWMILTVLFWPVTWPAVLAVRTVRRKLDETAAAADPLALAARVREQDARIAQLERELGIGSTP